MKHFHFGSVYFTELNIPVFELTSTNGVQEIWSGDTHFVSMYILDLSYGLNLGGHICEVLSETYLGISKY